MTPPSFHGSTIVESGLMHLDIGGTHVRTAWVPGNCRGMWALRRHRANAVSRALLAHSTPLAASIDTPPFGTGPRV